jgi:hypothetical protein
MSGPTEAEIREALAENDRRRREAGVSLEAIDPPPDFPVAEALAARAAVGKFWAALAADDDQAASDLFYAMSRLRGGFTEQGLAGQLRERMGVTIGDCASMGISNTVRVLPSGEWAFLCFPVPRAKVFAEPTAVYPHFTWIASKNPDGRWQVWGSPTAEELAVATFVQLPIDLLPTSGAIQ